MYHRGHCGITPFIILLSVRVAIFLHYLSIYLGRYISFGCLLTYIVHHVIYSQVNMPPWLKLLRDGFTGATAIEFHIFYCAIEGLE
jgi:hypothetical protein